VVPPSAEVWYYLRANKHTDVEEYYVWMLEIARAAARDVPPLIRGRTDVVELEADGHLHSHFVTCREARVDALAVADEHEVVGEARVLLHGPARTFLDAAQAPVRRRGLRESLTQIDCRPSLGRSPHGSG
jgi:hypothetical protein